MKRLNIGCASALKSDEESLGSYDDHFRSLFKPPRLSPQTTQLERYDTSWIKKSHIESAIKELPTGKAQGTDVITTEMLKALGKSLI